MLVYDSRDANGAAVHSSFGGTGVSTDVSICKKNIGR